MLTPVSASRRRAVAAARLVRTSATFCWKEPLAKHKPRCRLPALDFAEQTPMLPGRAGRFKTSSDPRPEPAAGSATLARWGLFEENELGIARDAARKPMGQIRAQL